MQEATRLFLENQTSCIQNSERLPKHCCIEVIRNNYGNSGNSGDLCDIVFGGVTIPRHFLHFVGVSSTLSIIRLVSWCQAIHQLVF